MGFSRIVSQENAVKILRGTLKKGRIPSAFIFSGDPLVGKTTTAIEYAKALNCHNSEQNDSCDKCLSCKKIERGLHPDLKIISPEKDTIIVDNIKALEEFVSLSPLEGKYKVAIIKNAEKLNIFAANAMLKTLEEPPPNTVTILTCENIDTLPEALISRAFKVYFKPLSREALEKMIDLKLERDKKEEIVKFSMGRPGFFLSIDILKKIQTFRETVTMKKIKRAPWKDNEEVRWWLDFLFILIRDMICFKILNDNSKLYFKLNGNFGELSFEEIFIYYRELQEIRKNIDLNLNRSILWNYVEKILRRMLNE